MLWYKEEAEQLVELVKNYIGEEVSIREGAHCFDKNSNLANSIIPKGYTWKHSETLKEGTKATLINASFHLIGKKENNEEDVYYVDCVVAVENEAFCYLWEGIKLDKMPLHEQQFNNSYLKELDKKFSKFK